MIMKIRHDPRYLIPIKCLQSYSILKSGRILGIQGRVESPAFPKPHT